MVPLCPGQRIPGGSAQVGVRASLPPWAPTHLPALPAPGACLLSSTSCLILSLETFRYLSQLHTCKKREREVSGMASVLPEHLLPHQAPPEARQSPVRCITAGHGARPVPPRQVAEWHQTQILGFTSHKNLLSRGAPPLRCCLATSSCQAGSAAVHPRESSLLSPIRCQKTPAMEVTYEHQPRFVLPCLTEAWEDGCRP